VTATRVGVSVKVRWTVAAGSSPVSQVRVLRDGKSWATLGAVSGEYDDYTVQPAGTYDYAVIADDNSGGSSSPMHASIHLPAMSSRVARVDGLYAIRYHTVQTSGLTSWHGVDSAAWQIDPACDNPRRCGGTLYITNWGSKPARVELHGSTYSITLRTPPRLITCYGVPERSYLTATFRPARAIAASGEWRATMITGTAVITTAPQLGCIASRATMTLRGSRHSPT
jgi:hypothetical protein